MHKQLTWLRCVIQLPQTMRFACQRQSARLTRGVPIANAETCSPCSQWLRTAIIVAMIDNLHAMQQQKPLMTSKVIMRRCVTSEISDAEKLILMTQAPVPSNRGSQN